MLKIGGRRNFRDFTLERYDQVEEVDALMAQG